MYVAIFSAFCAEIKSANLRRVASPDTYWLLALPSGGSARRQIEDYYALNGLPERTPDALLADFIARQFGFATDTRFSDCLKHMVFSQCLKGTARFNWIPPKPVPEIKPPRLVIQIRVHAQMQGRGPQPLVTCPELHVRR